MYTLIKEITDKHNINSPRKPKYSALESEIIEIFNGNVLKYESEEYKNNDNINYILGLYYYCEEINYDKMKHYYNLAIFLNNDDAMNGMGLYYYNIEMNYDLMKYYYNLAINLNNDKAMYNMGVYYQNIEINYNKMKCFYEASINLNNNKSMNNMGWYYQFTEINYAKMKYYYNLAINLNNSKAMNNMGLYYKNIEMNYELMKYFYESAILNNHQFSDSTIFNLNKLDQYILLEKLKNKNVTNKYITKESIKKINSYDIVIKYKNKCNILKRVEKCILCLDDGIDCIPLECAHYLCINLDDNCYSDTIYGLDKKCPICRSKIYVSDD